MAIEFTPSADRHSVSHEDALHAMLHFEVSAEVAGRPGRQTVLYIGHPHAQTERYLEVIAEVNPPRGVTVFHVMELTDKYRHLLS